MENCLNQLEMELKAERPTVGVCGGPHKEGRKAGIRPNAHNCASLSNYFGTSGNANICLTHHNP